MIRRKGLPSSFETALQICPRSPTCEVVVMEGSCVVMWLEINRPGSKSQCCCRTGLVLSFLFGEIRIMAVPFLTGWLWGLREIRFRVPYRAYHGLRNGGSWDLFRPVTPCFEAAEP